MIGYGNLAEECVLSGGAWLSDLPLSNLKDTQLGIPARSTGLSTLATQFTVQTPFGRPWRVLGLVGHNLGIYATYRITVADNPGFTGITYQGEWLDIWPAVIPFGSVAFEDPQWWDGRYTDQQRAGQIWTKSIILPEVSISPYIKVEISDPDNENGFVDIGMLFVANVWQPTINAQYGAAFAWEDPDTTVQRAKGGAKFFDPGTRVRSVALETNDLPEDEVLGGPAEIMRQVGTFGDVLFIWDPDDTVHALARQFVGNLRRLSPITHPGFGMASTGFEIEERVG